MNDEVKEILSNDNIHIIECEKNWCNAYGYEKSQLKEDLLDYITNLQKENDYYFKKNIELSTLNTSLRSDRDDYKSRCEKAIEYINKHCVNERISKEVGYKCYTMADTNELEKIIKILGDDEE